MKTMRKMFLFLAVIFLTGSGLNCSYSTRSGMPTGYRTIHVEPFKNKINYTDENRRNVYFPLMEVTARNAIVKRITFDGNLRIKKEPQKADLILKGSLTGYERQPLRYDENDNVLEYRIQVVVDLVMWDVKTDAQLWEEKGFVGETTYFTTGVNAMSEAGALDKAMEDLGRRVVERAVENW